MDHELPDRAADLAKRRDEAMHAGSEKAVARQHARNKMTARERIDYLLDDGSFNELGLFVRHQATGMGLEQDRPYTDGVVTGWGTVDGRQVFLFSQDFTVFGGSLGEANAEKVHAVMDMAARVGAPLVGLNDGAGARIQEGVVSLVSYGGIFHRNAKFSGRIPQISVIMGPCAGGAVYSPALTDFVFMVEDSSYMFITGPDVVRAVTGEDVTLQELGGAITHATRSGVAHFTAPDDSTCLDAVRRLLAHLPSNSADQAPRADSTDPADRRTPELDDILPGNSGQPYDMKEVIAAVVDHGDVFEYSPLWATQHPLLPGPDRRPPGGHRRQPAPGAGRRARHRGVGEGGPLRPHVRRLQPPAHRLRGRPRVPARHRPGARRHHPPRLQAALRLLRGHGPPDPGHHQEGLRRRLRGHELQVDRCRPGLRLADRPSWR